MRAGSSYRCPVCGERSSHSVPCLRCDAVVLDEHGYPPPPLFERKILYRGREVSEPDVQASGIGDLFSAGSYAVAAVARRISESGRLRRRRKALERVPRAAVAEASGSVVRVAGCAQVLEPADPKRPSVAFLLERERECGSTGGRTVETRVSCSKFLIHDESGAALVDDDFVAVLPAPGGKLPANGNALVMASDGQQVEVCGPAERRVLPDLGEVGRQHGYRREPRVLCFDGRPDALLLLRPLE